MAKLESGRLTGDENYESDLESLVKSSMNGTIQSVEHLRKEIKETAQGNGRTVTEVRAALKERFDARRGSGDFDEAHLSRIPDDVRLLLGFV